MIDNALTRRILLAEDDNDMRRFLVRALEQAGMTSLRGMTVLLCIASALGLACLLSGRPDRKSTRLNSSHSQQSRMPSSA